MSYIDVYKNFVKNEKLIEKIFNEKRMRKDLEIERYEVITEEDFPYIMVYSSTDQHIASAMIGINLDTQIYDIENFDGDVFYLPFVLIPLKMKDKLKDYGINFEQTIVHEKLHVKRILNWINEEPEYINNFLNFGFDFVNKKKKLDVKVLKKSIEFEVRKIFYLEVEALTNDFNSGETVISMPSIFGGLMEYKCETVDEFLLWQLTNYISNLKERYEEEFKKQKKNIEKYFSKYVNKYGLDSLGENAYEKITKHRKEFVFMMLSYTVKKMAEKNKSDKE